MKSKVLRLALILAVLSVGAVQTASGHPDDQHGSGENHLLGTGGFGDIELISVEELTSTPGLVADVAISPDGMWAFLANWGEPDCAGPETGGQNSPDAGAWVVDISNLSDPMTVGFIPSHQDSRPGEGMQVVNITTRHFNGNILVMNNEQCGPQGKGGVSLWDVTNPRKPYKLSEHFGDRANLSRGDANDIHSAFAWDTGDNAYVVMTDNFENADVDILDITKPNRPRLIREMNLNTEFPGILQSASIPTLTQSFLHDMVVKNINGNWVMLLSYWDAGYVQLNVNDPANPTLIGDTDYASIDPELLESTGASRPPEGNGHQSEFTLDNRFFIGTDEDFDPYTAVFQITTGTNSGAYAAGLFGWTPPLSSLPDGILNGPTVYGGYGCPADLSTIPPASVLGPLAAGEEAILVLSRGPAGDPNVNFGACFFSEKVEAAQNAGYGGVLIANHHAGAAEGGDPDAFLCGSQGHAFTPTIPAVCIGHRTLHLLFNRALDYTFPYPSGDPGDLEPNPGDLGEDVSVAPEFDGWGYVHLFSNTLSGGKFAELDTYAIDEAHDESYAAGFGSLTVHEVATDKRDPLHAYLSYYAGGLRSIAIQCADPSDDTTCELVETGGYLDPDGNDFWGVETFVRDDCTYIAGSDRDSGLWLFKRVGSCTP